MSRPRLHRARPWRVAISGFLLVNLALLSSFALFRSDAETTKLEAARNGSDPTPAELAPAEPATVVDATVSRQATDPASDPPIDPRHPLFPLLALQPFRDLDGARLLTLHDLGLFSPIVLRARHYGLDAESARAFGEGAEADSSRLVLAQLGVVACGSLSHEAEAWLTSIVTVHGAGWKDGRPSLGACAGIHALRLSGAFETLESIADAWLAAELPAAVLDGPLGLLLESIQIPGRSLPASRLLAIERDRQDSPRVRAACSRLIARTNDDTALRSLIERATSGDDAAVAGVAALVDPRFGPVLRSWLDESQGSRMDTRSLSAVRAMLRFSDPETTEFLESVFVPGGNRFSSFAARRKRWVEALDRGDPDPLALPAIHRLRARVGDEFLASLADRSTGVVPSSLPRIDRERLADSLRAVCEGLAPESLAWARTMAALTRFATPRELGYLAERRALATDPELRFRIDLALGAARELDYGEYVAGRR